MARKITIQPPPARFQIDSLGDLGKWVRHARTTAGLRIDDAAALCGVSVQLLSSIESGNRAVGFAKVMQVAQKMGLALVVLPNRELASAAPALEAIHSRLRT